MTIDDSGLAAQELPIRLQERSVPRFKARYVQDPIAVVGLACRLPGDSNTPTALWDFLERGGCAKTTPPDSRFRFKGHHDGSKKPKTMASPGGMFLENIDPRDIDAQFFKLSKMEAISMDPQQRQILEVVYEGLENAGISLEALDGQPFGCFVGSYASDYSDIQARDPEDRAPATTVGIGRAMLSNRISHFLNIKGPSMTIDTACSGSLIGVDVASRYLQSREINGAIVAACNLYLSPEHTMDHIAVGGTASSSGKCHTFDVKADGYIKSEAVNMVILKRLDDAIRDRDPIRAVIRGSATNSDGWTAGIASPSSEAQAAAIRRAYANANISDLSATTYLECHGTGTQAGDPIEVAGVASVFAASRSPDRPLLIGSIKSNIGHSEPAAGISGLLKTILALEKGLIPGNPTFETPNPQIDFEALRVHASKTTVRWPDVAFRRAGVNSFGYGGSNAHVIVDDANALNESMGCHVSSYLTDSDDLFADDRPERLCTLVFSANDEQSLRFYCKAMSKHLANPSVNIKLRDLAYTLSERRTRHFHRGYVVAQNCSLDEGSFVFGKVRPDPPRIGLVFTGQGAQWSEMGKGFVAAFPAAKRLLEHLDNVLHLLPEPPNWSLLEELVEPRTPEHLRLPEFSQPLVTALQLVILTVLRSWDIQYQSVVGHSSGEIAAAAAAGYLTPEEAIKIAYYRGKAASDLHDASKTAVGMLAVGLGFDAVQEYISGIDSVEVGCVNSPESVTLSGELARLSELKTSIQQNGHFARLLLVDLAYHSSFMADIATHYQGLLVQNRKLLLLAREDIAMFSSVTGRRIDGITDSSYWKSNMVSPVLFSQAVQAMVSEQAGANFLIEIGPSGALAGPIAQIKKSLTGQGASLEYVSACKRGPDAVNAMFDVAGKLFIMGGSVDISQVNKDQDPTEASIIIDLPNYAWNHSTKYWHESEASKDWRFRRFVQHDLLGSKVLGTTWSAPSWGKTLRIQDLPWLKDHRLGNDIVFPAAGYMAMAIEAIFQKSQATGALGEEIQSHEICYRLRDVTFTRAMVIEEQSAEQKIMLCLTPYPGAKDSWHEFKVLSLTEGKSIEHCFGLIRLGEVTKEVGTETDMHPLSYHRSPARLWYKAMRDTGYNFGPHFQKQVEVESVSGARHNRALISFSEPPSTFLQSSYPMHPVCIDGCLQSGAPSLWQGHRSSINAVLVPAMIDELTIKSQPVRPETGIAVASAEYIGVGRPEETKSYKSKVAVYDSKSGLLLFQMSGLRYHKLDTRENLHASHTYSQLTWRPDISFISQRQLLGLFDNELDTELQQQGGQFLGKINKVIDMIAHKTPNLKVMEINTLNRSESVWLDGQVLGSSPRSACHRYHLALSTTDTLLDAQERYGTHPNTEFSILDVTTPSLDFDSDEAVFDLVIVKFSLSSKAALTNMVVSTHRILCETGYVLFMNHDSTCTNLNWHPTLASPLDLVDAMHSSGLQYPLHITNSGQISDMLESALIASATTRDATLSTFGSRINIVHFSADRGIDTAIKEGLTTLGWQITDHTLPLSNIQRNSTVLVLDELHSPVLLNISAEQWQALQHLIDLESRILWVTTGSQLEVTRPDNALIHGLARTLRAEDPSLRITTLDLESTSSKETLATIHRTLEHINVPIRPTQIENELVERRGIVHIGRVFPDNLINQAERDNTYGAEPRLQSLHDHKSCVRLISERIGALDSLQYSEVSTREIPLEDGFVEVDIHAASLNFKDVAVAMGLVPADEHRLGLEGAGVIRRVGRHVDSLKVGQRVLVNRKGSFANRVQSPIEAVHPLPDSMSYEDAATLPCVYLVSLYGLIDLAHVQPGQSVLIHSAAGGVGIAAIQLCQYLGAKIYATVGTEGKREFLIKTFGISSDHIFTSRSTAFAPMLMSATNGKGVDVILNSLSGDILDESWRCIAEGGTFVEIGKKDMLDRNTLAMEPFCRNASYRAIDMSHDSIPLATIARLLSQTLKLISDGHVKPIFPRKVFSFGDIGNAFRYMRGGSHIGKILISDGLDRSIQVPVRPATPTFDLRSDVSYLIVGGLKGLCGSLAIFLARHGAKYLVVMSRSGYNDERSRSVLVHLEALGTKVDLVQGDVVSLQDVQQMFRNSTKPIAGVIQGAMILRDKIFPSMTVEEFHEAIRPKIHGTWNLHNTALEQNLPLDFFTMLSSISGVVGQKSQANYAAANVFLDSFSVYRRGLGLPACSVDLGVIEDVGYISEREALAKRLDTSIWTGINEGLLHKILRFSIFQQTAPINPDSASQMITGIPVPQKADSLLLRDARFAGLCFGNSKTNAADNQESSKDVRTLFTLLKARVDGSTLLAATIELVNRQFMKVLGLTEPMEPAKGLSGYGIDSLAAVEFRNWVRVELGAEITTLEIINAKTLSMLCESILTKIVGGYQ